MADTGTKLPVHTEGKGEGRGLPAWRPIENLRREVDRLFEDFDRDFWRSPFRRTFGDIEPMLRRGLSWGATPAVDIMDKTEAYEVVAELPGMDEKNIEVKLINGSLTIKGEKRDEKEEKKKRRRKRIIICMNAASAPLSAVSHCLMRWTPIESRRTLKTVFLR